MSKRAVSAGRWLQGIIKVRPEDRRERVQWTVAHEIGEAFSLELAEACGIEFADLTPDLRESICNHFAGALLVPTMALKEAGADCDWDLFSLKSIFATASHELIARRCVECCPNAIYTVCDEGKLRWRKSQRARRRLPWLPGEGEVWQAAHGDSQSRDAQAGGWRIRVWTIHEEHWKREVVRTESVGHECGDDGLEE